MTTLRYVGDGTYIYGVPARDLTEEEAAKFEAVIREQEALIGSVLYEPVPAQSATIGKRGVKAAEEGDNG